MHWSYEHIQNARSFSRHLYGQGFNFFSGVPCSLLGALIENLAQKKPSLYVPATREDAAIGMASGAYLAGKQPAVLMQNSGLGYSLNVLTSLNLIYKIPVLCLITYRGLGPDAPEHWVMGKSCVALLKEIGIESAAPKKEGLAGALLKAKETLARKKEPFAIFIKRGIFGS
ncbi:MAG: sulfopyruvate decarboxylase subunit alpha [Candidatus Omnitrophica bacterium]|nr:sulfopyruvate decarboxylase subunit alpha [Candidatus Omnitrophota bacterium]